MISLPITTHYPIPTTLLLAGKSITPKSSLSSTLSSSSDTPQPPSNPRRPNTVISPPPSSLPLSTPALNPFKTLLNYQNTPDRLTPKLRLTHTLSPPPPPPPPSPPPAAPARGPPRGSDDSVEFRQEGKIFVGNLPLWVKKPEFTEFFRQFGGIKSVVLVKGHDDVERNLGFGFVVFETEKSALKAVEFDGVEFHGRVLTVKLDDGRRLKGREDERRRWAEGVGEGKGGRGKGKWHESREDGRKEFRRVLETVPEKWQAVVRAFEMIKKV